MLIAIYAEIGFSWMKELSILALDWHLLQGIDINIIRLNVNLLYFFSYKEINIWKFFFLKK